MRKIRVLVVDDAVVVRKIVTDVLSEDPEIEIAGVAANGKIAVQKLTQCSPDIITLDVEMPEMNGIETVKKIRETHPKIPIIMFSTLTERGAEVTLDALAAGANDYVAKPANVGSVAVAKERVKSELAEKIKALVTLRPTNDQKIVAAQSRVVLKSASTVSSGSQVFHVVAIGVSTGGPNALAEVLPKLPANFPVPIVIVQHMPPLFTKMLADRLSTKCSLKATEGAEGMPIEAGNIYLAPGDYHMELARREGKVVIHTNKNPQENSCRPAVDPLFRSVVAVYGGNVLGVILTGMGQDGLLGCGGVKEAGGVVIVQDEPSSVVWGMPGYVAKAGIADAVLPLNEIAFEIMRRVKSTGAVA